MAINSKVSIQVEIKNIKKVADLKKELKDLRKEQKESEKQAKTGQFTSKKAEKQYISTAKAIKNKSKSLRDLNKNLNGSNKATKGATKSTNSLAKSFVKAAAVMTVVVGAFRMMNRAISSVVTTFSEFEFVMSKVNAVSGATESEFRDLTKTAEELGRTTFFTAAQVGELMLNFSKLGFTAREIQDAVQPTLDLATATGSDLARAALVAGAAVRGFGLDASETQRVVDVMAVSFSSSAMNIEKWQTSMTKVAPIAKAAGFSIEDTAAIMSKLTDSGIEASIAGTSLRNILLKMQDPTSELSMRFGKTIHSLDELVPAMKTFVAEGGSMADVMEVVDIRQAAAFEQMLTTADGTLALRDSLLEANGEGARMAGIVGDTLQGAFLKFTSAVQGLSISIMKDFSGGLQGAVEGVAEFMNVLAKNSKTIVNTIKLITNLIKWIGAYKLGVFLATAGTKLFARSQVLLRFAMIKTTGVTVTLTGAFTALRIAAKSAMSASGVGLILVGLTEIIPLLFKAEEETEALTTATEKLTKGYYDSLEPIEHLKTSSDQLIKIKGRMNKMISDGLIVLDKEGKIVKGNAVDQKVYNSHKGQAVIVTRGLNTALQNNDQALITEKSSIDDVTEAMDKLITSMTNVALVKGFQGEIEKITQKSANATVFLQRLADDMSLSIDEATGKLTGFTEADDISKMMYPSDDQISEHWKAFGEQTSLMLAFEDSDFDGLEHLYQVLADTDGDIESATKAFDRLAGKDGIGALTNSLHKNKKTTTTTGTVVNKWADDMALALLKVKQQYSALDASSEDYKDATITATKRILNEELTSLNKLEKKTKGQADRIIQIKTRLADLTMQQNDIKFKKELDGLTDTYNTEKTLLANKYTVNGRITETGNTLLLNLEATYLTEKGALHTKYGEKILGIDAQIATSNQKIADQQRKLLEEQISAMGGVGSALTSLAGDNEKLNFIKEAGNKISLVANTLSTISALKTNLETISNVKGNAAKLIKNTTEEVGIALDKVDIVQTGAKTGLTNLDSASNLTNATSEGVNTGATLANTVVTTLSLIPKAISSILTSAMSLPFPINLIAIVATMALVRKVMKFEKGGIVGGKYANGGMVHGKSHAQGGEKFNVGGRVNELEGGEAVINKRSTAMFRNQLSEMNQAGGGVKFADGGLMSSPAFSESQFNATGQANMLSSMNRRQKVVVVEADITNTQSTVSVIQANAAF
tara:strand:- start:580 stop:4227 length:3648 start_codon:yes stop_codon:yes gene_type:complete